MTNNTGLDFFKNPENFLTDLSDLESEYVRGGGGKGKTSKTSKTSRTSKSKTYQWLLVKTTLSVSTLLVRSEKISESVIEKELCF